ncbi:hypothetical protein Cgig2_033474 [Carnegiea gigantea]|uniref:Uncharacterized protein n=1 Tax=Carnegiea gigantea TaxID=171969 RepID=A0A9Q1JIS6_9CARY|nr:hypothetical protein Cgig2_033474 [Carnegiea gigantea]
MGSSSKSRSNAPVLPLKFSFPRSISPSGRFSASSSPSDPFSNAPLPSAFASSSSSSMASSVFHRPSSPTRVNLSPSSSSVTSFRISLNNCSLTPNSRAISIRDQVVSKPASFGAKRTCMCSPTTHPGSFRCSLHRNSKNVSHQSSVSCSPSRLNLRRSAMTNSLSLGLAKFLLRSPLSLIIPFEGIFMKDRSLHVVVGLIAVDFIRCFHCQVIDPFLHRMAGFRGRWYWWGEVTRTIAMGQTGGNYLCVSDELNDPCGGRIFKDSLLKYASLINDFDPGHGHGFFVFGGLEKRTSESQTMEPFLASW